MFAAIVRASFVVVLVVGVVALVLTALAHGLSEVAQLLGDAMSIRNGG